MSLEEVVLLFCIDAGESAAHMYIYCNNAGTIKMELVVKFSFIEFCPRDE